MFGVIRGLYRGARRTPMTSKRGHNYYKGTGSGAMGRHTKRGGYLIDWNKVRTYVVPDITDFNLSPYVSRKTTPPHGQGAFAAKDFFKSNQANAA
ncbi:60S ribosomal protein L27 [Umbelopsis nana]